MRHNKAMLKILMLFVLLVSKSSASSGFGWDGVIDRIHPMAIDSSSASFSIRFIPKENLPLQSIALYCSEAALAPSVLMSVSEDDGGKPSKNVITRAALTPKGGAWAVFQFGETQLAKGRAYHAQVEFDALHGGSHPVGLADKGHFAAFASTEPGAADGSLLQRAGSAWKPVAAKAVYIVMGRNGRSQGNSYVFSGAAEIHGNGTPGDPSDDVMQSQSLHFFCGTSAKSIRMRVRKVGSPSAPLELELLKHVFVEHRVVSLTRTTALLPEAASTDWRWYTVALPGRTPVSLPPECHYFALRSTAGRVEGGHCVDCWQASWVEAPEGAQGAEELTFDAGAHRSRAAWRRGDGPWVDQFLREIHIVADSADCPSFDDVKLAPVPTPEYLP